FLFFFDLYSSHIDLHSFPTRRSSDLLRVLRKRIMTRGLIALGVLIAMGLLKLPVERDLAALHRQEHFRGVEFNLALREKLGQLGDRKSTRLNSSHVAISYAVFCLKKK